MNKFVNFQESNGSDDNDDDDNGVGKKDVRSD